MQKSKFPTRESDRQLINEVKKHPILFDVSHPLRKDNIQRYEAWAAVTKAIRGSCDQNSVNIVKQRFKAIRDQFLKVLKSRKQRNPGDIFTLYVYEEELNFLLPYLDNDKILVIDECTNSASPTNSDFANNYEESIVVDDEEESVMPVTNGFNSYTADNINNSSSINNSTVNNSSLSNSEKNHRANNTTINHSTLNQSAFNSKAISNPSSKANSVLHNSTMNTSGINYSASNLSNHTSRMSINNASCSRNVFIASCPKNADKGDVGSGNSSQIVSTTTKPTVAKVTQNETESFFLCLAKSVKRLHPLNAAKLKKSISNIVMDAEIEELNKRTS